MAPTVAADLTNTVPIAASASSKLGGQQGSQQDLKSLMHKRKASLGEGTG